MYIFTWKYFNSGIDPIPHESHEKLDVSTPYFWTYKVTVRYSYAVLVLETKIFLKCTWQPWLVIVLTGLTMLLFVTLYSISNIVVRRWGVKQLPLNLTMISKTDILLVNYSILVSCIALHLGSLFNSCHFLATHYLYLQAHL